MRLKYLIRNPLLELYWFEAKKEDITQFTAFAKRATKFETKDLALEALKTKVPKGLYLIDEFYVTL